MSDVEKRCVKCGALFGASMVDRQDGPDNIRHYFRDICIRNLRAENERLRQDAGRYRWLRNDALQVLVEGPIVVLADKWGGLVAQDNGSHISIDGETLDKNIDAAMKASGSPADGGLAMSEKLSATAAYIAKGRPLYDEEYVTFLLEQVDALRADNLALRQDAERYRFQREFDWRYQVEHYGASEDERAAYIDEYDANYDAAIKEKNNES